MLSRIVVAGVVVAAMLLWLGPVPVPDWAVSAFVCVVLLPMGIVLSAKRMRQESRLARSIWLALTQR